MVHRILHGHKPVWYQAPISDYLTWRCCRICTGEPEPIPEPPYVPDGKPHNHFQVFRSPFS